MMLARNVLNVIKYVQHRLAIVRDIKQERRKGAEWRNMFGHRRKKMQPSVFELAKQGKQVRIPFLYTLRR